MRYVSLMAFGIYIHIPYCVQRCSYCDFATYEQKSILPPAEYVKHLLQEIRHRHVAVPERNVNTIYFGGGTPSLIDPKHIEEIISELRSLGFNILADAEITIEINPATINEEKLKQYRAMGINRFSVGAQSFRPRLLQIANRIHTADDTIETLELLRKYNLNFSFDLLFALPSQTLAELEQDVKQALSLATNHLSAYCLTVPESHPMSKGRAPEDEQVKMFAAVESLLKENGILRYEISNFAKPGFESQHNKIYWSDHPYWGVGLGAHSYLKTQPWGIRFWNPNNIDEYIKQMAHVADHPNLQIQDSFTSVQFEILEEHQSLTDYCHIFLRMQTGISPAALQNKFSEKAALVAIRRLEKLHAEGLLDPIASGYNLSTNGRLLSNLVFERLTFFSTEILP